MQIAIDGRNLISQQGSFEQYFTQLLIALAEDHPTDKFIVIVDKPWDFPAGANLKTVLVPSGSFGVLSQTWWERIKLPGLFKKLGVSVLIQVADSSLLRLRIPVLLFIANAVATAKTKGLKKVGNRASRVILFSAAAAASSRQEFPQLESTVVNPSAPAHFAPVDWEEKELIKQQFADGFEYFLFYANGMGAKSDLLNVLKAFSLFKLRQRTNMKLVIYGFGPNESLEELKTYKFREGVRVVRLLDTEQRAKLIAGAYAFLPGGTGSVVPMVEAMHCGVPVLTPATAQTDELLGSAMLGTPMNDPPEIAAQLKRIFLDEDFRSQLVSAAAERARELSWSNTVAKTWEVISKAVVQ